MHRFICIQQYKCLKTFCRFRPTVFCWERPRMKSMVLGGNVVSFDNEGINLTNHIMIGQVDSFIVESQFYYGSTRICNCSQTLDSPHCYGIVLFYLLDNQLAITWFGLAQTKEYHTSGAYSAENLTHQFLDFFKMFLQNQAK